MAYRILVIEDDIPSQDFISMALIDEGYEVSVTSSGIEGLQALSTFQPHLILLDMRMPQMAGETFLERYKQATNHPVPILAMFGNGVLECRLLLLGPIHMTVPSIR